jgi:hypothetical protein
MIRKAITSKDYLFEWNAPKPISGNPSITFKASSTVTSVMSHSRSDISVSAIANDRRTLTIASSDSLQRDQALAFLKTDGDTWYSVKVIRIVGTTAILAEPLSREIDLTTSASIEFAMWYYTALSANVTSTSGTFQYIIDYTADLGQNNISKLDKGIIKVTPRPFDTGLDHDSFVSRFAPLADMIPRRQSDFAPQIKAALDEISLILRDKLSPSEVTEDEIFNAESFQLSHAYCTAARIYEMNLQLDATDAMRSRCIELLDLALRSIDLDLDGDGIIDTGEIDLEKTGGKSTDFRASWKSYTKTGQGKDFNPTRSMGH